MPQPARTTVFPLPVTSHANPIRGEKLLRSRSYSRSSPPVPTSISPCAGSKLLQIVLLAYYPEVVVAHSEIDRQVAAPAKAVLNVARVGVLKGVAPRVADCSASSA